MYLFNFLFEKKGDIVSEYAFLSRSETRTWSTWQVLYTCYLIYSLQKWGTVDVVAPIGRWEQWNLEGLVTFLWVTQEKQDPQFKLGSPFSWVWLYSGTWPLCTSESWSYSCWPLKWTLDSVSLFGGYSEWLIQFSLPNSDSVRLKLLSSVGLMKSNHTVETKMFSASTVLST